LQTLEICQKSLKNFINFWSNQTRSVWYIESLLSIAQIEDLLATIFGAFKHFMFDASKLKVSIAQKNPAFAGLDFQSSEKSFDFSYPLKLSS